MDLSLNFHKEQKLLNEVFAKTLRQLSESERTSLQVLFFQFVNDLEANGVQENLHFFPMFLKQQKLDDAVVQIADYEYLIYSIGQNQQLPFESKESHPSVLRLNPSWAWIILGAGADVLKKKRGAYALWKNSREEEAQELHLSPAQAEILNVLGEDRKFNFTQLVDWAIVHFSELSSDRELWSVTAKELISLELVQQVND